MLHRSLRRQKSVPVTHQPAILKKVLLERGELPALTNLSQAVFCPGDTIAAHAHPDMWEVFFVRSGTGAIRVDGTESPLVENHCWVIEPGEIHSIHNDGTKDLVLLYFGLEAPEGESLEPK